MSSKLKEARLKAGYSIEDVSLKLNIRKQYLIDLEEENFEAIPGQIYVDGYIKLYSDLLGIERPIINIRDETNSIKAKYKLRKTAKKRFSQKYFIIASILLLIIIFSTYNYIKIGKNNYDSGGKSMNHYFINSVTDSEGQLNKTSEIINIIKDDGNIKNLNKVLNDASYNTGSFTNN